MQEHRTLERQVKGTVHFLSVNAYNLYQLLLFFWMSGPICHHSLIHATYVWDIPVMTDLSHRYGGSGAATAQQGDVGWLRRVLKVLEKDIQSLRFGALVMSRNARKTG